MLVTLTTVACNSFSTNYTGDLCPLHIHTFIYKLDDVLHMHHRIKK